MGEKGQNSPFQAGELSLRLADSTEVCLYCVPDQGEIWGMKIEGLDAFIDVEIYGDDLDNLIALLQKARALRALIDPEPTAPAKEAETLPQDDPESVKPHSDYAGYVFERRLGSGHIIVIDRNNGGDWFETAEGHRWAILFEWPDVESFTAEGEIGPSFTSLKKARAFVNSRTQ